MRRCRKIASICVGRWSHRGISKGWLAWLTLIRDKYNGTDWATVHKEKLQALKMAFGHCSQAVAEELRVKHQMLQAMHKRVETMHEDLGESSEGRSSEDALKDELAHTKYELEGKILKLSQWICRQKRGELSVQHPHGGGQSEEDAYIESEVFQALDSIANETQPRPYTPAGIISSAGISGSRGNYFSGTVSRSPVGGSARSVARSYYPAF